MRVIVSVAFLTAACGGGEERSPEGVARAYVQASFAGDKAGMTGLWATRGQLEEVWRCEGAEGHLVARSERDRERVTSGLFRWEQEVRFVHWKDAERTVVKAGETRDGCTALRDVELERGGAGYVIHDVARPERSSGLEHHRLTLMRLRDAWRIVDWSP